MQNNEQKIKDELATLSEEERDMLERCWPGLPGLQWLQMKINHMKERQIKATA